MSRRQVAAGRPDRPVKAVPGRQNKRIKGKVTQLQSGEGKRSGKAMMTERVKVTEKKKVFKRKIEKKKRRSGEIPLICVTNRPPLSER